LYPISYAYLRLLGASGLRASTQMALLSANYIAKSLEDAYPVRYTGEKAPHTFPGMSIGTYDVRLVSENASKTIYDTLVRPGEVTRSRVVLAE